MSEGLHEISGEREEAHDQMATVGGVNYQSHFIKIMHTDALKEENI